jgi:imidazole glycerol phosphate synthase subunit HisF
MKKLLLGALLLLSVTVFSQEVFVKKYTSVVSKKEDVLQPWKRIDVTVVFNSKGSKDIVFYYATGNTRTFYQITDVTEGETEDGQGYQFVYCIDQDGDKVGFQLFNDDTCLRILIAKGYMVEFHND